MSKSNRLCSSAWLYSTPKRKKPKKKTKGRKFGTRLERYAHRLNVNLPASEKWFQSLFKQTSCYKDLLFFFNRPCGAFIPDVVCYQPRIIIEIDGSIHDTPEQQFRDKQKDAYFIKREFKVFRIKAYSSTQFNEVINQIKELVKTTISD